jgi:hypothetical protein
MLEKQCWNIKTAIKYFFTNISHHKKNLAEHRDLPNTWIFYSKDVASVLPSNFSLVLVSSFFTSNSPHLLPLLSMWAVNGIRICSNFKSFIVGIESSLLCIIESSKWLFTRISWKYPFKKETLLRYFQPSVFFHELTPPIGPWLTRVEIVSLMASYSPRYSLRNWPTSVSVFLYIRSRITLRLRTHQNDPDPCDTVRNSVCPNPTNI